MDQQQEPAIIEKDVTDRIYFTITPRLVWALCTDPFEYTYWSVVKDIAGENGQCILARDDLAILCMMSAGKASACLQSLIAKKLLIGDFRRDAGYPQPVWHLRIPDFWEANVRWARKYISLKDRISFKREQAAALNAMKKRASSGDGSKEASSGDEGGSPHDGGVSPDDTKKNVFKNQLEKSIYTNWDSVLEQLRLQMPRGNYELYVKDLPVLDYIDQVLYIGVPNADHLAWLESRITSTIENLLIGVFAAEVTVKFQIIEVVES